MTLACLIVPIRRGTLRRVTLNESMGQLVDQGGKFRLVVVARAKSQRVGLAHTLEHDGVEIGLGESQAGRSFEQLDGSVTVRSPHVPIPIRGEDQRGFIGLGAESDVHELPSLALVHHASAAFAPCSARIRARTGAAAFPPLTTRTVLPRATTALERIAARDAAPEGSTRSERRSR